MYKRQAYADARELLRTAHGAAQGRILVDVSPHAEYTTRPDILADMAALAAEYGVRMHTHLSETRKEQLECVARHGMTPAAVMREAGVLDQPVTLAHCVWPVSYTHLDVYKRQTSSWSRRRKSPPPTPW